MEVRPLLFWALSTISALMGALLGALLEGVLDSYLISGDHTVIAEVASTSIAALIAGTFVGLIMLVGYQWFSNTRE